MTVAAKRFEDLPLSLKVEDVAAVLGISRRVAYSLTRQKGFPAVRVGEKRLIIPRDRFLQWLNDNADRPVGPSA